jgi:large conductance mechanosensitive channel
MRIFRFPVGRHRNSLAAGKARLSGIIAGGMSKTSREAQMGMMQEFRQFAMKGNVVDLAVGVIIGGAFGKIVDSLVQDVIMPPIGKIFGGLDFASYYLPLNGQAYGLPLAEAKKAGAVLAYGNFLTILLNFIILAFIIFQMVRVMNRMRNTFITKEEEVAAAATAEEILLLREIRDSLKSR